MNDVVTITGIKSPAVFTGGGVKVLGEGPPPLRADTLALVCGRQAETPLESDDPEEQKEILKRMPLKGEVRIEDEDGTEYILGRDREREWCSRPLKDVPYNIGARRMVRIDPPKTEVFNLSKEEDMKRLNKLESLATPDFPGIEFAVKNMQFHEGVFHLCLTYNRIWYKIPN